MLGTASMGSGDRMWEPSPSPEEMWSDESAGANGDGEWRISIVGEELRLDGTSRYEVRWENWQRPDGSNTTWETENFQSPTIIGNWKRMQKRMRNILADESVDMEVSWPDDAVHKRLTDLRRQAYDEKLGKKRRMGPEPVADWDAEIEKEYQKLDEQERGDANSKLRLRRVGSMGGGSTHTTPSSWSKRLSPASSVFSSRDQSMSSGPPSKRSHGRPRIKSTPSTPPTSATPTTSTFSRKSKMPFTPSSAGSSREVEVAQNKLPAVIITQPTLRGRISSAWNKAAKEARAATVRISPNISDEDIPRSLRKFKYVERGYTFRAEDGLQKVFDVPRGAFMRCDCVTCLDASSCSCRDLSKIYDLERTTNFLAYSEGLFTFEIPRGVDVVECNKYCGCDDTCGNRVVQLPRKVGLEVFKTHQCGWGVRPLEDVPQGKVLGTYTGTLIPRNKASELPKEHHDYMFDLDSTEVRNSENLGGKYTVDCYECGNWTRFVNHSCSPNMEVYCVVYDTIPDVNMPYVAFAALIDIAKGTELTIDYHPYAEEDRKGKQRASGKECRCGSDVCRGWL